MKKVLVLMVSPNVKLGGGIIQIILNYKKGLEEYGFVIDYAINIQNDNALIRELTKDGTTWIQIPDKKKHYIQYLNKIKKLCKNGGYDVIHIHGNSATMTPELFLAKKYGIRKRIAHIHSTVCKHKIVNIVLQGVFNRLYTDALACSRKAGERIFTDDFQILNNAINLYQYRYSKKNRDEIRRAYHLTNEYIIGHVGKFYEPKNHEFLIKLFAEFVKVHPSTVLMLVGDGELLHNIEILVEKLGVTNKVFFMGMRNDVSKYYSAFDCFVMPSLWEGLPLVCVEAQASGLRCVLSENITRDVDLTGENVFISLNAKKSVWLDAIEMCIVTTGREDNCDKYASCLKNAGFNVNSNKKILIDIYNGAKEVEE